MVKKTCPQCGGRRMMAANVKGTWMGGQCPTCHGTGVVEETRSETKKDSSNWWILAFVIMILLILLSMRH